MKAGLQHSWPQTWCGLFLDWIEYHISQSFLLNWEARYVYKTWKTAGRLHMLKPYGCALPPVLPECLDFDEFCLIVVQVTE